MNLLCWSFILHRQIFHVSTHTGKSMCQDFDEANDYLEFNMNHWQEKKLANFNHPKQIRNKTSSFYVSAV